MKVFRNVTTPIARIFGGTLLLMFTVSATWGDRVVLKTGRSLEGAILSESPTVVELRTQVGTVRVAKPDIVRIERSDRTPEEVDGERAFASRDWAAARAAFLTAQKKAIAAGNKAAENRIRISVDALNRAEREAVDRELARKFDSARAALAAGRLDEAENAASAVVANLKKPAEIASGRRMLAEIYYAKAQVARDRQDYLSMSRQLQAAVQLDPNFYRAQLALGRVLIDSATSETEGLRMIETALRSGEKELSDLERGQYLYVMADRLFLRGKYQEAATNFVSCIGLKNLPPEYSNALDRAVECYVRLGESGSSSGSERTLEGLAEALRLNPTNKKALFLMGRILYQNNDFDAAIERLKRVVELEPTYKQVNSFLAKAYLGKKDYDNALAAFDKELESSPSDYNTIVDRAEARLAVADYTKAREDVDKAKSLEPESIRAYLVDAQLNIVEEKYEQALASLKNVLNLRRDPKDAIEAYLQMGRVLAKQKKPDDARKWFETVTAFLEKSASDIGTTVTMLPRRYRNILAESSVQLGMLDLEQENPRQAEMRFSKALEVVPDYAAAFARVGDVRRRLADEASPKDKDSMYGEAESSYKKAIDANRREPDHHLSLAILYHRHMKQPSKAVPEYKKYLELGGRDRATAQQALDEIGSGAADTAAGDSSTSASDTATTATDTSTTATAGGTTATATAK